jgi:hypothetical protein
MANLFARWRSSLERLIFAGLRPDEAAAPKKSKSKMASLMESAEDLAGRGLKSEEKELPGPATLGQKLGIVAGILMVVVFVYVLVRVLGHPAQQTESTAPPPPPVQIVPNGFKVDKNKDLEVVHMEFNKNKEPKEIIGTLHNLTDKSFAKCEVSFEVTTRMGEQLGGVTTTVNGLEPHGSVKFRIPVPQKEAGFAMVRELRTD